MEPLPRPRVQQWVFCTIKIDVIKIKTAHLYSCVVSLNINVFYDVMPYDIFLDVLIWYDYV